MERQLPIGLLLSWDTLEATPTQKAPSIQGSQSITVHKHPPQPASCGSQASQSVNQVNQVPLPAY